MSLRVLHVLDHSLPLQSGYTFRTRAILHEQRRMGWETFHLTTPKHTAPSAPEEEIDGLHFYRTPWDGGLIGRVPGLQHFAQVHATTRRLDAIARRIRPHILHAHSPCLNGLAALSVGKRLGIPVVYEVRAFWEDAAVDHGTAREGGLRYRLSRALETRVLREADAVTTICEGLKRDIVGRGIPEQRVTVIPNAVNLAAFPLAGEPDADVKRQLGLEGKTVIGFIGSFYAYEGLDLLLAALPRVLERVPQARVLLVGGGPQEPVLRSLATALGLHGKVLFAGRVPHDQVQRYYSVVDVFAYPRHAMRLTDLVTPLKPLEAMAQGRLLVASDVGGHRELIRDGENGILFRAGDAASLAQAIVRLLEQRERWPQLRAQGRRFVEQERNWPGSVARYREVFGRLSPAAP
jgi:PEP-CTERM/exosortase A-associated glycosyltransferase